MASPPRVSIVIPSYNYAQYVGAAIDCALAQTYPHVEVVVVDDGSTDHSVAVIASYGDRVRLIRQENRGAVAAYNRGFEESSGELVLFLDADDLIEPDAVAACVAVWREGVSKVQFDLRIIDAAGRDLRRRFCHFVPGYDAALVRRSFERTGTYRWPVTTGNVFARAFVQRLMPVADSTGHDGFLNSVAPLFGEVETLPACLGSYRLHGANSWASGGDLPSKMAARIAHRRFELSAAREVARSLGVPMAEGDPLDHEIAFLNYRMVVLARGERCAGDEADTARRLWGCAMRLLWRDPMPWGVRAAHALWFTALAAAPAPLVPRLLALRYGREPSAARRRAGPVAQARP